MADKIIPSWRPLVLDERVKSVEVWHRERLIARLRMVRRDAQTPIFDDLNREMGTFHA